MYTQCPECDAVLAITAADLAVAGGFARCGDCGKSFDALQHLSDQDPIPAEESGEAPDDTGAGIIVSAEDALLTEPADVTTPAMEAPPAAEADDKTALLAEAEELSLFDNDARASLTAADDNDAEPATGESVNIAADDEEGDEEILLDESYTPPEIDEDEEYLDDEWNADDTPFADGVDDDQLFAGLDNDDDADLENEEIAQIGDDSDITDYEDESALFDLPLPELTALERDPNRSLPEKLEGGAAAHDPFAQGGSNSHLTTAGNATLTPTTAATSTASDAYDAEDARDLRDYLRPSENRAAKAGWGVAAALMALLLIGQLVHRNRGDLVIHPRLGPAVSSLYQGMGMKLRPNWRISDYKIVGQARLFEMPSEEAPDTDAMALRFVAIISNGAELPQPPPMVRLTLRNRWGDPTGVRDFTPAEYLADRTLIGELLEPGQRLRVVLNLHDPGSNVVGFDFDMCLPDAAGTLRCANES